MSNVLVSKYNLKWMHAGVIAGVLGLCSSCSDSPVPPADDEVLVRLKGDVITLADVEAEEARYRESGRPSVSRVDLMNCLIEFKAQSLRARELNLDDDPAIRRRMDQLLVAALREREMSAAGEAVSAEEVRQAYQERIDDYTRPAADRFAMLFLAVDPHASVQKRDDARRRLTEARQLALAQLTENPELQDFGELPLRFSDDQISRYRGGDIGWSTRGLPNGRLTEFVYSMALSLQPGEISELIEDESGIYLVMKTDFRPESIWPYDSVASSLRQKLIVARDQQVEQNFIDSCLAWAEPDINEDLVRRMMSGNEPPDDGEAGGPALSLGGMPSVQQEQK